MKFYSVSLLAQLLYLTARRYIWSINGTAPHATRNYFKFAIFMAILLHHHVRCRRVVPRSLEGVIWAASSSLILCSFTRILHYIMQCIYIFPGLQTQNNRKIIIVVCTAARAQPVFVPWHNNKGTKEDKVAQKKEKKVCGKGRRV